MNYCNVCTILFPLIGCAVCNNGQCFFLNLIFRSMWCQLQSVHIESCPKDMGITMIRLGFDLPATSTTSYQYYIPNMPQTRIASHFAVKICKTLPEAFCTFTSSTQISRGQALFKNAGRDVTKGCIHTFNRVSLRWCQLCVVQLMYRSNSIGVRAFADPMTETGSILIDRVARDAKEMATDFIVMSHDRSASEKVCARQIPDIHRY